MNMATPETPAAVVTGGCENETEEQIALVVGSPVLTKSIVDPFDYSIMLRTGEIIRYESAELVHFGWLHLDNARFDTGKHDSCDPFPRGIDVRISDIVWAKDAPYGS